MAYLFYLQLFGILEVIDECPGNAHLLGRLPQAIKFGLHVYCFHSDIEIITLSNKRVKGAVDIIPENILILWPDYQGAGKEFSGLFIPGTVGKVCIDYRALNVGMAEPVLDESQVCAGFYKVYGY